MENRDDFTQKVPFYMTYPMQNLYLAEMEYEKDMERMKELYPKDVEQIQRIIEEVCDQMEHEGSRMYDENPDRLMLEQVIRRILERFLRENPQYGNNRPPVPPPRPDRPMPPPPPPQPRLRAYNLVPPEEFKGFVEVEQETLSAQYCRDCKDSWLDSLVGIMFHNELYRRRCRHRRCHRWSM